MLEFALALLATLTVGALLLPFLRGTPAEPAATDAERFEGELRIYRDQLAEIEAARVAGTLPEAEAAAARLEIERRILAAAEGRKPAAPPPTALHRWVPPAIALLVPLLALGRYLRLGHPGLPAAPFVAGASTAGPERQLDVGRLLADARARVDSLLGPRHSSGAHE